MAQAQLVSSINEALDFVWLEITHKCQLECVHCYTDSSPSVRHGALAKEDWMGILAQIKSIGAKRVQFIGGEPTLSPFLPDLLSFADELGLRTSIYSNLIHLSAELWTVVERVRPEISTSLYSADYLEHDAVTTKQGSFARTMSNVHRLLDLGLTVHVGVVKTSVNQKIEPLVQELRDLGVATINIDEQRPFGRGESSTVSPVGFAVDGLCGRCADDVAVIDPNGKVHPCIMSRFFESGDLASAELSGILESGLHEDREILRRSFATRPNEEQACNPDPCNPHCSPGCPPIGSNCPPNCAPMLQGCPPSQQYCSPTYQPPGG